MYQTDPPLPPSQVLPTMYDLPSEDPLDMDLLEQMHPRPPRETMPTMYDLPSEDPEEPGLPDEFHDFQPQLLRETCKPPNYPTGEMFIGTDLNLYYDARNRLWHKRPDWFLVLGVSRAQQQQDMRLSYVVWQEGIAPFLVVELLSPGTEAEDLGQRFRDANKPRTKWLVYEQSLRIPYYIVFDRYQNQLRVFQLTATRYQAVEVPEQKFWLTELELGLGVWSGSYQQTEGLWLRWYDSTGNWIATPEERAEQESQRAEQQSQRAEQESQRAERLAERLRSLGVDPNDL
ncbi:Uma2 family endonuclease [Nostoc sp.]|uniref:Uma2 family endonuclease n=1 Tax=Nostoc sp. TaxID=1180 RepID=UPI002FF4F237